MVKWICDHLEDWYDAIIRSTTVAVSDLRATFDSLLVDKCMIEVHNGTLYFNGYNTFTPMPKQYYHLFPTVRRNIFTRTIHLSGLDINVTRDVRREHLQHTLDAHLRQCHEAYRSTLHGVFQRALS